MHIHSFIPEVSSVYTTHSKTNKGRIAHKKKEKKIKKKKKLHMHVFRGKMGRVNYNK